MKPNLCSIHGSSVIQNYKDGCSCNDCIRAHDMTMDTFMTKPSAGPDNRYDWAYGSMNVPTDTRIISLITAGWNGGWGTKFFSGWGMKEPLLKTELVASPNVYVCKRCNIRNPFAGPEHLATDGTYTCYECKR